MAIHSLVKIWVHFIWGTHNHEKIITPNIRKQIFTHLIERADQENVYIEQLNIRPEHVHMLFKLPSTQSMEAMARMFKGESSHWINENNITRNKFRWQRGYGAFSVSEGHLERVKYYIKNQDSHHRKKSYTDEYEEWRREYGIHED